MENKPKGMQVMQEVRRQLLVKNNKKKLKFKKPLVTKMHETLVTVIVTKYFKRLLLKLRRTELQQCFFRLKNFTISSLLPCIC